jgi:hypothetical protein
MPSLAEIRRQIEAIPERYVFWTQKEIRALPQILDEDERIVGITSGYMNGATWLAVCTQRRLIFLNRGMFYGLRQVQLPLDRIQSIDHSFTICFGGISIWDGASSFSIGMVLKSSIMPFVRATEEAMYELRHRGAQIRASSTPSASAPSAPVDVASQLAKLADLKEKGYLTEEEFQSQKKKLLG